MLGTYEISCCHLLKCDLRGKMTLQKSNCVVDIVLVILLGYAEIGVSRQKKEDHMSIASENILAKLVLIGVFSLNFVKQLVQLLNYIGVSVKVHQLGEPRLNALGYKIP